MQSTFDLAIVGSGGGAFAAAIRATMLGKSVVMIERGTFGGTCVNTGCVPSKALLAAAEARHVAADAGSRFPGIAATADLVDMPALIAGKQDLVEAMRSEKSSTWPMPTAGRTIRVMRPLPAPRMHRCWKSRPRTAGSKRSRRRIT